MSKMSKSIDNFRTISQISKREEFPYHSRIRVKRNFEIDKEFKEKKEPPQNEIKAVGPVPQRCLPSRTRLKLSPRSTRRPLFQGTRTPPTLTPPTISWSASSERIRFFPLST